MRESERDREGENLKKINRELDRDGDRDREEERERERERECVTADVVSESSSSVHLQQ